MTWNRPEFTSPADTSSTSLLQVDAGALADREGLGGGVADRLRDEVVEQLDDVAGARRRRRGRRSRRSIQQRLELREVGRRRRRPSR